MDLKFLQEESKLSTGLGTFITSNYKPQHKSTPAYNKLAAEPEREAKPRETDGNASRHFTGGFKSLFQPGFGMPTSTEDNRPYKPTDAVLNWRRSSLQTAWNRGSEATQTMDGSAPSPLVGFQHDRDSFLLSQMQGRMDQWNSFHRNRHNN